MTSSHRRVVTAALLIALSAIPAASQDLTQALPHASGARRMVLEQLELVLASDPGLQIIGQGSWLRAPAARGANLSRNYADPLLGGTSDHDLRLVMQGEDGEVLRRWRSVRERLAEGLRGIFRGKSTAEIEQMLAKRFGYTAEQAAALARRGGDDLAQVVLRSVNLYPPPQVMRGVVNDRTARALFTRAGAVPSLAGRIVEGVWGEGAPAMIQTFESQGRLFYSMGGKVRVGFTDLTHLAEGYGRHTMGGYANMAFQWAEKAAEAMHERDAEAAAKYLARLKNNLERAKAKGNLGSGVLDDALRELDTLIGQAKAGSSVFDNPRLAAYLREARLNARLLGELARNPGAMDRQVIEAILGKSTGRLARFGEAMREVWARADNWTILERSLQGVFVAWSVMSVADTWGERGMEQALRQAGADVAFLVAAVPGIMMTMTNMVLDAAKDAGYALAISPQHYDDFLAGISSVRGYQGETGINRSIEQLATDHCSRAEIERFVQGQALAISQLKWTGAPQDSEATTEAREGIRTALVQKMTPIVYREFLRVRKERLIRAIDHALSLDDRMNQIVLRAQAVPVLLEEGQQGASVELRVQADTDWTGVEEELSKLCAEVEALGGRNTMATGLRKAVQSDWEAQVVWTQGGRKQEASSVRRVSTALEPRTFTFTEVGPQSVTAVFSLEVKVLVGGGADIARDVLDARPLLVRRYTRTIPVAVDVSRVIRAKPTPPKTPPLRAPERVGVGEVFTLRFDKRQMPDFKPGEYKLLLVQPGKRLTFEDAALLQFDPSGAIKPDGVRCAVSVLAERTTADGVEIDAQVRQAGDFARAEALELALVKLDTKGSASGEIAKAVEEMEKAEKELEAALEKMTPKEREAFEKKMEEAMAAAEKGELPAPKADELPAPPMYAVPLVVRPPQLALAQPPGWTEQTGLTGPRRAFTLKKGPGGPGNHVDVEASVSVSLEDGVEDRGNGDIAAGTALSVRESPGARVDRLQSKDGYAGERARRQFGPAPSGDPWRYGTEGGAVLRRGDVFLRVQWSATVEGYRRVRRDEKGAETVLFDTRPEADREWEELLRRLDALFASLGVGAQTAGSEPPVAPSAARGPDGEVRLEAARPEAAPGEIIEVACIVDFPKPGDAPYRYEWSGNHAGEGDRVLFLGSDPGEYTLGVLVRNAAGTTVGSTSVTLRVR